MSLNDTIASEYAKRAAADPRRKALEAIARGWAPDPQLEAAIASRDRDPAAFAAAMAAQRQGGLNLALYERGREAAIKLGTFVPPTEGDAS
jgi:hypothetical protein